MRTLRLVMAVTIKAKPETVFAVLSDLKRYPKIFRYIHDLKVKEKSEQTVLAEVKQDMFGILTYRVLTRFTFEPNYRVVIEQLKGPFEKAIGWFELKPQGNGTTRLVHGAEITATGLVGKLGLLLLRTGEAKRRMKQEIQAIKYEAER